MTLDELKDMIAQIELETRDALKSLTSADRLRQLEAQVTGKKGRFGELMSSIGKFPKDQRGAVGQVLNSAKGQLQALFDDARQSVRDREASQDARPTVDTTLPGVPQNVGSVHPVTLVQWEVERVFERLGFTIECGPEMETDYYNFQGLNIPDWHPARDMQDTFWLESGFLLRTHTSPVQVRSMEKFGPPLRCIAPGRCFRYETTDHSHENTFHQCEGLMIDKGISIANLIAVMKLLLHEVFQRDVKVRLRPGYFPFVEPGFELDMACMICDGVGCPTCKRSGWVEILPCGMVHPNVLRYSGIDPQDYSGFAFGLGLTRLAMMKYGYDDIRVMNSGNLQGLMHRSRYGDVLITDNTDRQSEERARC